MLYFKNLYTEEINENTTKGKKKTSKENLINKHRKVLKD